MPRKGPAKVRAEQLEALSEISRAITSELYLEDILKLIVTVTAGAMRSKICSLMLLDEKTGQLYVRATQSVSEAYIKKPPVKVGDGIAGRVARTGRPVISKDVKKDPNYINRKIAAKEKLCSLLCVPLKVGDKVIGVLNCYTSRPHRFTGDEINILSTVANQAAVAIRNTELMVNTQVIREELESRKLVERAKDVIMQENRLSGAQAYRLLQRQSMNSRKSMKEIAEAVILAHNIRK